MQAGWGQLLLHGPPVVWWQTVRIRRQFFLPIARHLSSLVPPTCPWESSASVLLFPFQKLLPQNRQKFLCSLSGLPNLGSLVLHTCSCRECLWRPAPACPVSITITASTSWIPFQRQVQCPFLCTDTAVSMHAQCPLVELGSSSSLCL